MERNFSDKVFKMSNQATLFSNQVILYSRVSTKIEDHNTISAQEAEMERWCNTNGLRIIRKFSDMCSGLKDSECRDGLKSAIELARKTGAKIATPELSRLTRSITDTIELMDDDSLQIIFTRHNGRTMNRIELLYTAVSNQMSSEATSTRVSAGIQNLFLNDPTAQANWGRANDPKSSADMTRGRIEASNRFALQNGALATALFESGKSFHAISKLYTENGIQTMRGKFKWNNTQIQKLVERYVRLTRDQE